MTCFRNAQEVRTVIGGFLERFPALDPILRQALRGERMVMKVELTDPEFRAEIDSTCDPLAVRLDSTTDGTIGMSGPADHFHLLLLGRLSMAVAINHKKLLVRGSTAKLMNSAPLFYLAPYLYPFYLASLGRSDLIANGPRPVLHLAPIKEDPMTWIVNRLAWLSGYALGLVKKHLAPTLDVVTTLESLGQGMERAAGKKSQ